MPASKNGSNSFTSPYGVSQQPSSFDIRTAPNPVAKSGLTPVDTSSIKINRESAPFVIDDAKAMADQEAMRKTIKPRESMPFLESAGNSIKNLGNRLEGALPRLKVMSTDIWEAVLGKEGAKWAYENINGEDIDTARNLAYAELASLDEKVKPTEGNVLDNIMNLNVPGLASNIVDAATSLGSTAIPAALTAGAGLVTETVGDSIVDFNKAKAKSKGITVDELYERGENELAIPATIGAVSSGLEYVGLKGAKNLITDKIKGIGLKKALIFFGEANKEGLTELIQTGLDDANLALANGKNMEEASKVAVESMFSKKGLESYIMGTLGSGVAGGLGRLTSQTLSKDAKKSIANDMVVAETISSDLQNPNISDDVKSVLTDKLRQSATKIADVIDKDIAEQDKLSPDQKKQADELSSKVSNLETVIADENVSEATKKILQSEADVLNKELETIKPLEKPKEEQINMSREGVPVMRVVDEDAPGKEDPRIAEIKSRMDEEFANNPNFGEKGHVGLDKIEAKYDAEIEGLKPLEEVKPKESPIKPKKETEQEFKDRVIKVGNNIVIDDKRLGKKEYTIKEIYEDGSIKYEQDKESDGILSYNKEFNEYKRHPDRKVVDIFTDNGFVKNEKSTTPDNTQIEATVQHTEDKDVPVKSSKTIKELELENKKTAPKIPVKNIFKNEVSQPNSENSNEAGKAIESKAGLPTEKVSVNDIIPTQKNLTIPNLENTQKAADSKEPIYLIKENGKYYVADGHHRIANEILNGNNEIEAQVYDADKINKAENDLSALKKGDEITFTGENGDQSGMVKSVNGDNAIVATSIDGIYSEQEIPLTNIKNGETIGKIQDPANTGKKTSSESNIVPEPKAKETASEQSDKSKTKDSGTAAGTVLESKFGDPLRAFADKVRKGKINKLGGFKASTGFDAAWDLGVEAVAISIEGGAKLADSIESGLKAIKKTDWYKNIENKSDFDEKYNSHMRAEYAVEENVFLKNNNKSAIKNSDVAQKRNELGLEERDKVPVLKNEELVNKANEKIKKGYDVEQLIDDIIFDSKQAEDSEVVILKQYQLAKEQELIDVGDKIIQLTKEGKGKSLDNLIDQRDKLIDDIDRAYQAGERTGTITAKALQARKIALANDYSLANMLIQKRKANDNKKLGTDQIEETINRYNKIADLNEEFKKKISDLEIENNNLKSTKAFKKIKDIAEYESRKNKRQQTKETLDEELNNALDALRKKAKDQRGNLSANAIPIDFIPDIARIATVYAKKGINTVEGIADSIFNKLKNDIEGLTKKDIEDALVNFDYDSINKESKRLSNFKQRTSAKIAEIIGKTDNNDFSKKKFIPIKLDEEAQELQDRLRKARYDWDLALEKDKLSNRTRLEKIRDITTEVFNTPRALMASVDFSAPLRQGLVLGISHPIIAAKAFTEMFRQSWSQQRFDRYMSNLTETPGYDIMKKSGLYLADTRSAKLAAKEEQFMSNVAEKIPIIGRLVKGSERAYVGYLNKLRADVFAQSATLFENEGNTIENNPKLYKALGSYINSASGRGNLGTLEDSAQILNSTFFSPRLIASRISLLTNWANSSWYENTPKEVRLMYAKDMLRFISVGTTILALASAAGADVEKDPRSSDFGKIKVGDTRWDIWGGFQQYVRFISQFATGQRKSTSNEQIKDIGVGKYKPETRADLMLNMFRGKLSPIPSNIWSFAEGKNIVGEEYTYNDLPKLFLPLFAADLYTAVKRDGPSAFITTGLPGVFGVSVQNYESKGKPLSEKELKLKIEELNKKLKKSSE